MSASRLTLPLIRTLTPGDEVADAEIRGLTARASSSGSISYSLRYRAAGSQRRVTLGSHPAITPDAARTLARDLLARVARGEDPSAERAAARAEATMEALFILYMEGHGPRLAPKTRENYSRSWRLHIAPFLGSRRISSITRADVVSLHASTRPRGVAAANKALRFLSAFFSWAVESGHMEANPAAGVRGYREEKLERFLSPDERRRLWGALDYIEGHDGQSPGGGPRYGLPPIRAIRLLSLTGARKSEVMAMKWADIDLDGARWRLPTSKTGRSDRPLLPPAVAYLRQLLAARGSISPLVVPGEGGGEITTLDQTWGRLRATIGLDDVRLHDLRHSLASDALAAGQSLAVIGRILGHTSMQSTMRYAHLADDVAAAGAVTVGERLTAIHEAPQDTAVAVVLPIKRR
ncbi:MAG: tyrosine-type recombinase/integrase [Candidatus Eisenbacteria bacterium]|nr:tyrosine-type recombinase/integrase [Candidatus Eisenbacteria bacterium]